MSWPEFEAMHRRIARIALWQRAIATAYAFAIRKLYTLYFQLFPIQIECNTNWGLLQIPINKILECASCLNLFHFFFVLTIYLKLHKFKKNALSLVTRTIL
jgi:hypothetical protein